MLAHEMAHVTLNHATARSELELRSALVSRVVADVLNDPTTGAQLQSQSRFALARFSREQELEADATGVRTLAKAGYDPFAAGRFLTALNRSTGLKAGSAAEPDMLATHPGTAERITQVTRAARRIGAPGIGIDDRASYLAAVDGLAYGDNPRDGAVRGHRFIHPGLGIAFEVPDGFALENTRAAVLGTTHDGNRRLLFDQIDAKEGQSLDAVLKASWNDAFDPAGFETRDVGGHPAAFALSRGKDWTFRLAAIRIGDSTYRMIMAAKGATDPDPAFRRWTATLGAVSPDETALRPLRLQVVQATSASAEELARRMAVPDRALDRFLVLNGLERGAALVPGPQLQDRRGIAALHGRGLCTGASPGHPSGIVQGECRDSILLQSQPQPHEGGPLPGGDGPALRAGAGGYPQGRAVRPRLHGAQPEREGAVDRSTAT